MLKLEDLQPNAALRGVIPDALATVVSVQWFGSEALELTYKNPAGKVAQELLYRHDEQRLDLVEQGRPWSFDGNGSLFRLVAEAQRIRLAHLFDPVLAVHTSEVVPLPHQITAVYECMLSRQPLRFLLADDPGAGKTIMAGLLIKELIARGDLQRCLIVCPGSLAEQWQDELYRRFHLPFEILTNDKLEAARTGNWFLETPLVIARLDKLSRNEDVQQKLQTPDCRWDLVVCDEAHKMSATFFGGEVKYTKRYRLGQILSSLTRHFLLMTATPHNGKEEDFQLFMALLDGDRFEGRFRDGVHASDVSDLMRRMVKENLLKFDGTPLFPERIAYTVPYKLSAAEAHLYKEVTDYVREEFNRADALQNDKRAGTVGFALTILQRRLASSPEAIFQSLRRRRERLESRQRELELLHRAGQTAAVLPSSVPALDADDVDELEEAPDSEVEAVEQEVLDQATAARSIAELKAEIASTGWEAFLDAAIGAGFAVTGTWPIRTERSGGFRNKERSSLASSIVLACRPRDENAKTTTRRGFVAALKAELPHALDYLQSSNIAPVDLAQAAIGPGMAVYTRYSRVLDAEGRVLSVREAPALINQTLDEALAEQEGDFDADTRWALAWFDQQSFAEGEYGVAETLSKAKNTSVSGLVEAGILSSNRGKVRLLKPNELPSDWDPEKDKRLTVWETVHHLIRALESGGEPAAAALVAKLGSKAEVTRELAYRLYTLCERKKRATEALAYNGIVQSWPEIVRLAKESTKPAQQEQSELFASKEGR